MKMSEGKPGNVTLIGLTLFAILVFVIAEKTAEPERQPYYEKKLQAAKTTLLAMQAIKDYSRTLGISMDLQNDPYRTGLIGQERTPITSDRGVVNAKILAANPNFAAAFVDMLVKAKVKKRSVVAVGMTGSLPGWNIAFLAACDALELTPVVISSVGASDWGANLPSLTWLDMERVLNERGILQYKSTAASTNELLPFLNQTSVVAHWSGLRPGSPDNIPIMARHPTIENLYLNSGHFRYGVTMAPASALFMANLILGFPNPINQMPYRWPN